MTGKLKSIIKKNVASLLLLTAGAFVAFLLFWAALFIFVLITKYVFIDQSSDFDHHVFHALEIFISPQNNDLMMFITRLGDYQFLVAANLLLIFYFLFIRRHKWYSVKIPAIALGSLSIMLFMKHLFNRPRPAIPLLEPASGLSFPSGHAMSSITFYGLLIYFIWNRHNLSRAVRILLVIFLVILILLIGLSRVYLRVHYATDVIAGFCAGFIWLFIAINVFNRIQGFSKAALDPVIKQTADD